MTIANPFNCFVHKYWVVNCVAVLGGISYGLPWSSVEQDQLRTFIVVSYKKNYINLRRQHGLVVLDACLVIRRS